MPPRVQRALVGIVPAGAIAIGVVAKGLAICHSSMTTPWYILRPGEMLA
jgi:hypothetical protein